MNRHYWYYRFLVDTDWLNDFIDDIEDYTKNLVLELSEQTGVVSGLLVSERGAGQNFSVDVSSGSAYDEYGQRIYNSATTNVPFTTDALGATIQCTGGGNSRVVSVYAYYEVTDSANVVDGNGDTVPTVGTESIRFELRQGTIATTGTQTPASNPNDGGVLLAHVTISTGDTTIATADCNNVPRDRFSTSPKEWAFDKHLKVWSNLPVYWDGANLYVSDPINIECRAGDGTSADGTLAAGTYALSNDQCLILRLDRSATAVTYDLVTYGSMAAGKYAITDEDNLSVTDVLHPDDIILFKREDVSDGDDDLGSGYQQLHMPWCGQRVFDHETFYLGKVTGSPISPPPLIDGAYNLGISMSAGVFTIKAANGTDLSAYNPGWVVLPSNTFGRKVRLRVAQNYSFTDNDWGVGSDLNGELFGMTTGLAWQYARPFFIYAVNSDDTDAGLSFGISPDPVLTKTPVTANIGYKLNPMASPSDIGMFIMSSSDVTTTHDEVACLLIGALRFEKFSNDHWKVQPLVESDGIGQSALEKTFGTTWTFPRRHMGATTANDSHLAANGGTAPTFTIKDYFYKLNRDGSCKFETYQVGDGGTNGVGAVTALMALPYVNRGGSTSCVQWGAEFEGATTITSTVAGQLIFGNASSLAFLRYLPLGGTATPTNVQNAMFSSGSRTIRASGIFQAF